MAEFYPGEIVFFLVLREIVHHLSFNAPGDNFTSKCQDGVIADCRVFFPFINADFSVAMNIKQGYNYKSACFGCDPSDVYLFLSLEDIFYFSCQISPPAVIYLNSYGIVVMCVPQVITGYNNFFIIVFNDSDSPAVYIYCPVYSQGSGFP